MPDQYRRNTEDDRRDDRRGWPERASDEVRSWVGDDDARARRGNDERHDRYPYGGDRDRSWQDQGDSEYGREQRSWRSHERGQGWERGGSQQYGRGGSYGSSSYDRGSYGRGSERDWPSRGDERPWSQGAGQSDWNAGRGDRWAGESERSSRWGQGRESEGSGRPSFGGYGTGGSNSGRYESGSYSGAGYGGGNSGYDYGYGSGSYGDRGAHGGGQGSGWQRESYSGRGPKDYKRSDDRIREEISDRLTDDHQVDATEISVQVQGGEVTLTGTVPNRDQKRRAEDLAESISGVREVTNNLRVNRADQSLQNPLGLSGSANADTSSGGQAASQAGTSTSAKSNRATTSG